VQIGRVVGHATSTVKHASLSGWRLLIVQLLTADGREDGEPLLAIDALGAGKADRVIVCNDGAEARAMVKAKASPVRWFVMGICDA
jgi:ethanolamine utilization protein EutN